MISIGILLSLLAGLFKAGKSISTKFSTNTAGEYVTSWSYRTVSAILFAILFIFVQSTSVPTAHSFWIAAAANAIALSVTTILITKAFKLSDISVIAPLMAILPILVTVPAWIFLNEKPTLISGVGIILVAVGAYLLEARSKNESLIEPIRRLRTDKGAQYIVIMLLIASVIPTIDKIGLRYTTPLTWVLIMHIGISVILTIVLLFQSETIVEDITTSWLPLVLIGFFNAAVWLIQLLAYEQTQVAYVQAIKRGSIFISILAGYFFFQETNIRNRLIGAAIIFLGITFIILGA